MDFPRWGADKTRMGFPWTSHATLGKKSRNVHKARRTTNFLFEKLNMEP